MMWIYPTVLAVITVWLIQIGERPDALGAMVASVISAMVCFVKEFEE